MQKKTAKNIGNM